MCNKMDISNLDYIIGELDFYHEFQPIIDLSKKKIFGFEALIRSQHFNNPELLFNYTEEHNQLFELDLVSVFKAIYTFSHFWEKHNNFILFVNVYPSTLMNPSFSYYLKKFSSIVSFQPCFIVFEINEAEKALNSTDLKESILNLKKQGFLIALDDVGKGESTIKTILEIDPDIVKTDRYFAKNLTEFPKKQKVIELMIELCGIDTQVIVEGIETSEDLQTILEIGVPFGQGYFLGKPKPIDTFSKPLILEFMHHL